MHVTCHCRGSVIGGSSSSPQLLRLQQAATRTGTILTHTVCKPYVDGLGLQAEFYNFHAEFDPFQTKFGSLRLNLSFFTVSGQVHAPMALDLRLQQGGRSAPTAAAAATTTQMPHAPGAAAAVATRLPITLRGAICTGQQHRSGRPILLPKDSHKYMWAHTSTTSHTCTTHKYSPCVQPTSAP